MSKESLSIKARGNLIRIDSKVFTENSYSCDEESESGCKIGGKQNAFGVGISLKKGKVKVIFTTLWKSYDLEIVNIISGKLMYMGYGDGKF